MDDPTPKTVNIIQRMPAELQLIVLSFLNYQDAIRFSQASRYFHAFIDLQKWPATEKMSFMHRALAFPHNLGMEQSEPYTRGVPRNINVQKVTFGCHHCFKVKAISAFSMNQIGNWLPTGSAAESRRAKGEAGDGCEYYYLDPIYDWVRCCIDCMIAKRTLRHAAPVQIVSEVYATLRLFDRAGERSRSVNLDEKEVLSKELMKFCVTCQRLHLAELWCKLQCTMQIDSTSKKSKEERNSMKLLKKNLNFQLEPLNRFCGVCNATEPSFPLGDFYCPTCMIWVCWSCCVRRSFDSSSHYSDDGELHELRDDSRLYKVHQMLMHAQDHPDLPAKELLGAEDHMLADVSFLTLGAL